MNIQEIRDTFTLADYRPLLTDPEPSPQQLAKIAESCRFYFILLLSFTIVWVALSVKELVRNQGDDALLGYIGLATSLAMVFLARRYYLSMLRYRKASQSPQ